MKKIYLLASSMLIGGLAFGQYATPQADHVFGKPTVDDGYSTQQLRVRDVNERGSAFWTEDFSGIGTFPNPTAGPTFTTANGVWTAGGVDANIWKHSFFNTSGEWSVNTPNFASTTAADGFMLFDADSVNFVVSPNYVDRAGDLTSPSIDLSGQPTVKVEFEQYLRYCCAAALDLFLSVSTDGGNSWTDFNVLGGLPVNQAAPNPELVGVNITSVAANQPNVLLKWSFGGTGVSHYFWAIDDINLVPAPDHDMELIQSRYSSANKYSNSVGANGQDIWYTKTPVAHIQPFEYKAYITNNGVQVENNVTLDAEVLDGAMSSVYTGSSAGEVFNQAEFDTLTVSTNFTPPGTPEDYTVAYNVNYPDLATDANNVDNVDTAEFIVTDFDYARHRIDAYTGAGLWNNETGGISDPFEMGLAYQVQSNDQLIGLSIVVDNNTDPGVILYASIYEDQGAGFQLINTTAGTIDEVEIFANNIASPGTDPVCVFFPIQYTATAGVPFICVIGHYGGPEAFYIANGGPSDDQTCYLLDGTDNTWYYVTSTPWIEAHFSGSSMQSVCNASSVGESVANNDNLLSQNVPNPFNTNTMINYVLEENTNVSLAVTDLTGKVVHVVNRGSQSAGVHNIKLDAKDFAPGVYYYTLTTGDQRSTKKMVVAK